MPERESNQPGYELGEPLGRGGMAEVFRARQTSLGRDVAVKRLYPDREDDESFRKRLLWEAEVLARLDHPNIVPIYDVGQDSQGRWFYSMKEIRGRRWAQAIGTDSLDQNLEILLKVADAIAFAHSKGISHLDLKPSNVMLGEFGEVLVTDWGVAKTEDSHEADRERGTPEYAAPEIARGQFDRMGPHSDIYLLGAILFEMVAGKPPHKRHPDGRIPFLPAAQNRIESTDAESELLDIARHAMRTLPEERYGAVHDFQKAIRSFQSHAESIVLEERAQASLKSAESSEGYDAFQAAVFGFENAFDLWPENTKAREGAAAARLAYGARALDNGDFDLGLSLLDANNPQHADLARRLEKGNRDRQTQQQRLRAMRWALAVGALVSIVVLSSVAWWGLDKADRAETAQAVAEDEKKNAGASARKAFASEKKAKDSERQALASEKLATDSEKATQVALGDVQKQRKKAEAASEVATSQARKAREEAYFALIGSAESLVEENSFARALDQLRQAKSFENSDVGNLQSSDVAPSASGQDQPDTFTTRSPESPGSDPLKLRNWEWGRLSYLASQALQTIANKSSHVGDASSDGEGSDGEGVPANVVALSPDGKEFITGGRDGRVRWWQTDSSSRPEFVREINVQDEVLCAVFLPLGREPRLVIGTRTRNAYVQSWSSGEPGFATNKFSKHNDAVVSIDVSRDGRWLITSSLDGTTRVWDVKSGLEVHAFQGHRRFAWKAVFDNSARSAPSDRPPRILTAGEDGVAIVWDWTKSPKDKWIVQREWEAFGNHYGRLFDVEFFPLEDRILTAGEDGRIVVWQLPPRTRPGAAKPTPAIAQREMRGHTRAVRDIRLTSENLLLSGGDDNTVRLWNLESAQQLRVFRGHSGSVRSVDVAVSRRLRQSPTDGQTGDPNTASDVQSATPLSWFVSTSRDGQVKLWRFDAHREAHVFGGIMIRSHQQGVLTARFSADGRRLVTAGLDRTGRVHQVPVDVATIDGDIGTMAEGHDFPIREVVFLKNPAAKHQTTTMLTSSVDSTVRIWDEQGLEVADLAETGRAAALAATSKWIATGSDSAATAAGSGRVVASKIRGILSEYERQNEIPGNGMWGIKLWKVGNIHNRFQPDLVLTTLSEVTCLAFSADGRYLLSGHMTGRCMLWDFEQDEDRCLLWGTADKYRLQTGAVNHVAFLPDGKVLAATVGGEMVIWRAMSGQKLEQLPRPAPVDPQEPYQLTSVATAANGTRIAVALSNQAPWVYDLKNKVVIAIPGSATEKSLTRNVNLSPDGKWLIGVASDGKTRTVRAYALEAGIPAPPPLALSEPSSALTTQTEPAFFESWNANALTMVTISGTTARRWRYVVGPANADDVAAPKRSAWQAATRFGPHGGITSACFSPAGKWLATAGNDKLVKIWDGDGHVKAQLEHPQQVNSVVFTRSHERLQILTACEDGLARLWDVGLADGSTMQVALPPTEIVSRTDKLEPMKVALVFFQNGVRHILTAGSDGRTVIWDAGQRGRPREIETRQEKHDQLAPITCAAVSPDGTWIVTGSGDSARLRRGDRSETRDGVPIVMTHTAPITSVAFSPDGLRIITGSADTTAKIWEAPSGRELLTLRGHAATVTSVSFPPTWEGDLRYALTSSRDGAVILWPAKDWTKDNDSPPADPPYYEPDAPTSNQSEKSSSAAMTSSID